MKNVSFTSRENLNRLLGQPNETETGGTRPTAARGFSEGRGLVMEEGLTSGGTDTVLYPGHVS